MSNSKRLFFIAFLFFILKANAQECELSIQGHVFDFESKLPLSYVNVFIQETSVGTVTDDEGNFLIENICEGEYHLIFSHIGCEAKKRHLVISKDTLLNIELPHSATSLGAVVIHGKIDNSNTQSSLSINRQMIEDNSNKSLSGLLETESGVQLIKNGSGISKPVVHGLYGNRLTILNNGIVQSGQQWGNDHAPEIDPYVADKITVIKGANAIEYGAGNLGGLILIEPKSIGTEPHLHGQYNYTYETNGRGHSMNTRVEKYSPLLAWRISGTLKNYGDRKAVDYFLTNTGVKEANFSVKLEKSWKDKLFLDFYASTFNTELGVLRGSHIGNTTDLEQALTKDIPFFTEPNFSYTINAPKQQVSHQLAKLKSKYYINEDQIIEFVLAGQLNDRKEFDVRRSGREDIPSLNLKQYSFDTELSYTRRFKNAVKLKFGNQNNLTDNTNNPDTGILPLIPDYISWKNGFFSTLSTKVNNAHFNLGIRYDYEYQNVLTISSSVPKEIIKYENEFHNVSGLFAIKVDLTNTQTISFNAGYSMRNPGINERYSNGLHQGVSGIEQGDINLDIEKSVKNTLEYKWLPNTKFSINVLGYHQNFTDYIFLNPTEEIRLTIRGAFPVFQYTQTDARIYGLDVSSQFTISHSLFGILKYSYLKGEDNKNNVPLIFLPSNSLFGSFVYRTKNAIKLSKTVVMDAPEIELNSRLVFKQNNILPEQDFANPPPTYHLVGLKASTNVNFQTYKIRCFIKADNLLNVKYRDYLNRQRYFADDLGRSITFGLSFKF